jgi:pimeloyl-ACP methyl ester carboxylesterase
MANFVLVHGAWGGGQTYGEVPDRLRAAGHQVLVCALRGLGSRQAELHPGITLTDHVDDVCAQVEEQGFDRFVLAGHSYGGMVIAGAASRLGARIDAICYLDAFLPRSDESLWDITGDFEHDWYIQSQRHHPGLVAPIGGIDFEPVPGQVGYHPLLTLLEAIPFSGEETKIPRHAYVFANAWEPTPFRKFASQVQLDDMWEYHEAETDHFVMGGAPEQVSQILLGLAA